MPLDSKQKNSILTGIIVALSILLVLKWMDGFGFLLEYKNKELTIDHITEDTEFYLEGYNGSIYLEGTDDDKITLDIQYKPRVLMADGIENEIILQKSGSQIIFQYPKEKVASLSVEGTVPKEMLSKTHITSSNGSIAIDDVNGMLLDVSTTNGKIEVKDGEWQQAKLHTSNGKIEMEEVRADKVELSTMNGKIQMLDVSGKDGNVETMNGSIEWDGQHEDAAYTDMEWKLKTSNAKIELRLDEDADWGYEVQAKTSNGSVECEMDGMQVASSSNKSFAGMSQNFEDTKHRLRLNLRTSNGKIEIEED